MVKFVLFNELSLPFDNNIGIENEFINFFKLIGELKKKEITSIRVDRDFKSFEVLKGEFFPQFFGQLINKELKDRLREFITNGIIEIEDPLIQNDEDEDEQLLENEYFYNSKSTIGAFACCDIWNSMTISFNSNVVWNQPYIEIEKQNISEDDKKIIKIRHASFISHLDAHVDFFYELEKCIRMDINISNFWDRKDELFRNKIILCDEVKKQIANLDNKIFIQALSILRDIDGGIKDLGDFITSGESLSVEQDKKLKKLREFKIDGVKEYFQDHIKSLSNGYRIHYFEKNEKIYIGYIGKHLPTKKFD